MHVVGKLLRQRNPAAAGTGPDRHDAGFAHLADPKLTLGLQAHRAEFSGLELGERAGLKPSGLPSRELGQGH